MRSQGALEMASNMESRVLAFGILTLIPLFLFYMATSLVSVHYLQIFVAVLLLIIMAMVFIVVKDVGVCQPYLVVMILTLIGVPAKYLYIISGQDSNPVIDEFLLLGQGLNVLDSGLVFVLYAFTVMSLFYMISKRRQYTKPLAIEYYVYSRKFVYVGALILAISLFTFSYLIFFNDLGFVSGKKFSGDGALPDIRFTSLSYYLLKLSFLVKVAFYIFLLSYLSPGKNRMSLFLLIISFMATLIISYYVSNRASLVVLFLDFVVIMSLYKGRVPIRLILSTLIILTLAILVISDNRSAVGATKSIADHIFGGRYLFDLTKNTHFYNYLASGNQLFDYSSSTLLTDYMNLGRFSGKNVFGMDGSGVPLGYPVELFSAGGWLMLTIGMAALGIFYRALTLLVAKKVVKDYMIVIYSIVMTRSGVYLFNNGIGVAAYQILLELIPFLVIIYLLKPEKGGLVGTKAVCLKRSNK
jgi:hypothetical protein